MSRNSFLPAKLVATALAGSSSGVYEQPRPQPAAGPHAGPGKNPDKDGGTKVLTETQEDVDLSTPWNVVVYNDPVNLMPYVTMVIRKIFGYTEEKATSMMLDVHQKGLCVVWTGEKEQAELYVRQLQGYQLMAAMKKAAD